MAGLCIAFRLGGARPVGIPISGIANPKIWLESECSLVFHCDASGKGIAGFMAGSPGHLWVATELPKNITLTWSKSTPTPLVSMDDPESVSSGYCEAAALYLSLLTFLPIWADQNPNRPPCTGVWAWSDSQVVVDMWAKRSACDTMLPYLREYSHLEALYNITLIISHIDGKLNTTADALSRKQMDKFFRLQPAANRCSLPLPLGRTLFL